MGQRVATGDFAEHVFGVTVLNDWSARDIQAWEYVPLGPFLGKSFATSISAWITPLQALDAARTPLPGQDPAPLEHLQVDEPAGYDIAFEVELNGEVVSRPPYAAMYWSPAQMLAHLTSNGASLRTGDLYASGTISGDERDQRGSFLELSWGGKEPFGDGRTFLEDGDVVTLRATAPGASVAGSRWARSPGASFPPTRASATTPARPSPGAWAAGRSAAGTRAASPPSTASSRGSAGCPAPYAVPRPGRSRRSGRSPG